MDKNMKILIVIDQYDNLSNGTTISARRFVEGLRKKGHEVKVLSTGKNENGEEGLKAYSFPKIIDKYFKANEMVFAKPNEEIMRKEFEGQDIIHFYMPFKLSREGVELARKMKIPHTTAFHVQPENITYAVGLGTNTLINDKLYSHFRTYYNKFRHIHCPSNFIAKQLEEHGYKSKLHVISNGVEEDFKLNRCEKPKDLKGKIVISMVGRYSPEKRQDVLIDAISKSKYSDKIQLILGGKGQCYEEYKKQGEKLKNKPIMKFYPKEELINMLSYTDIYVHSADAEIEAISCLEAIALGNVPIISNSKESATVQFAMDSESLFEHGNSLDLAKKIDYFLDNPEYLEKKRKEYSEFAKNFKIEKSIELIEEMFKEEIRDYEKER